jgi:hypothetical protein
MNDRKAYLKTLSDEEIIQEFVKRFECDAAVLIYLDSNYEFGFGKWQNLGGKQWVQTLFNAVKEGKII